MLPTEVDGIAADHLPQGSICHVNSYYCSSALHHELVERLAGFGWQQDVFVPLDRDGPRHGQAIRRQSASAKIHYRECFSRWTRLLWPIKSFQIQASFRRLCAEIEPPQMLHAHSLITNGLIAYRHHRKAGTPYVVTVRNTDINIFMGKSWFFRQLGSRILNKAAAVLFLSPAYRDVQLRALLSPDRFQEVVAKSHIIPNGINDFWIDNQVGAPRQAVTGPIKVLFAGKLRANKNVDTLIAACNLIAKEGHPVTLDVVGDGPEYDRLRGLECHFAIRFHGYVSAREQLMQIYRDCDLMVVPSFRESFGLVYAEAMSQGLAVIYSKNQGFDGFFPDGLVGFAADAYDLNDIAGKILRVRELLPQLSKSALASVGAFHWNAVASKLGGMYQKILSPKSFSGLQ